MQRSDRGRNRSAGESVFRREKESTILCCSGLTHAAEEPGHPPQPGGDEFAVKGNGKSGENLSTGIAAGLRAPCWDRSGVVAIFARVYGGRDRLAKRFKGTLARRLTNIYSVNRRMDDEVYE